MYGSFALPNSDRDTDSDWDPKPNGCIVLCTTFHIAWTGTWIPTPYFCVGQESESESIPESVSGSVNEPLNNGHSNDIVGGLAPFSIHLTSFYYMDTRVVLKLLKYYQINTV